MRAKVYGDLVEDLILSDVFQFLSAACSVT